MMTTDYSLSDYTIYECILHAAEEQLEALAGVDLPFLAAWPAQVPNDFDEDTEEQMILISFEDEIWDQTVEGTFPVGEDTLKGIAEGREQDVKTFVDAILPVFRPSYVQAALRHEFHTFESEDFEDQRLIKPSDAYDVIHGFGTAPWRLFDVTVEGVKADLFRVEVIFQNEEFGQDFEEQTTEEQTFEHDILMLPLSLTWEEFTSATETRDNLIGLLKRIHSDFLVRKDDLEGHYSAEAEKLIDYWDALAEGDEERLAEDPFTTGELGFDDDGRVHLAKDFEN